MLKRKKLFINDKRRRSYLSAVYNRIYRGKSVLIEGDYGVGKSRFLNLLKPKKLQVIRVESLFNIHETLASILRKLSYDVKPTYRRTPEYLERICNLKNHIIVVDEANDLNSRVRPFMKRIIDAEVPVIFAGLPKVRASLAGEHPDILSRLKVLVLYPIKNVTIFGSYQEHTAYRIKVVAFCQSTISYKDSVPAELLKFMHGWWVKHILESDMKYRTFLTERSVK